MAHGLSCRTHLLNEPLRAALLGQASAEGGVCRPAALPRPAPPTLLNTPAFNPNPPLPSFHRPSTPMQVHLGPPPLPPGAQTLGLSSCTLMHSHWFSICSWYPS